MSEEQKKLRTVSEIQNEYSGLCARAGHLQYQIATLGKDLAMINDALRDLNSEANESKAAETRAAEAPKVEEKKE